MLPAVAAAHPAQYHVSPHDLSVRVYRDRVEVALVVDVAVPTGPARALEVADPARVLADLAVTLDGASLAALPGTAGGKALAVRNGQVTVEVHGTYPLPETGRHRLAVHDGTAIDNAAAFRTMMTVTPEWTVEAASTLRHRSGLAPEDHVGRWRVGRMERAQGLLLVRADALPDRIAAVLAPAPPMRTPGEAWRPTAVSGWLLGRRDPAQVAAFVALAGLSGGALGVALRPARPQLGEGLVAALALAALGVLLFQAATWPLAATLPLAAATLGVPASLAARGRPARLRLAMATTAAASVAVAAAVYGLAVLG